MPPKVDEDKCQGSGQCVEVCPADPNCFEMGPDVVKVTNPDTCLECGACEAECPNEAIILE